MMVGLVARRHGVAPHKALGYRSTREIIAAHERHRPCPIVRGYKSQTLFKLHRGIADVSTLMIVSDHFTRSISSERARQLFKSSVSQVEIEVFTYCNRKCYFCPNSYIDRRSTNTYMQEDLYLKILGELRTIEYGGVITYSRYNEPLADRIILSRLRQAKELVPNAALSTHSNGDYLDRPYLEELRAAGLNILRIQSYLGNRKKFSDAAILTRMSRQLNKLGYPYKFTMVAPGVRYIATVRVPGMEVTVDARNFDVIGVDRGQTITLPQKYKRISPCLIVFQHLYIDHDGSVVPCCNIRSDEPRHKLYVIDKLTDKKTIFEAYANSVLADWRRSLLRYGEKNPPCNTCSYEVLPDRADLRAATEAIAARIPMADEEMRR
jgi:radical SAM protein with 4Fe4S-binding SPASM domain